MSETKESQMEERPMEQYLLHPFLKQPATWYGIKWNARDSWACSPELLLSHSWRLH